MIPFTVVPKIDRGHLADSELDGGQIMLVMGVANYMGDVARGRQRAIVMP